MAVPANPVPGSRALYYPYAVPAPTYPTMALPGSNSYPQALSGGGFTQPIAASVLPPDIGNPGQALPATVLSVAGAAPDYSGLTLLVHLPNGTIVQRSAGFTSNQPMLNVSTWTTNGSNALQCRWQLMDALA